MRFIYLAGGPKHGTVLQADDLKTIDHQPEYQAVLWRSSTQVKDWKDGDTAVLVHISVHHQDRESVAAEGDRDLQEKYPDAGA